jgi:hypothetical protein
VDRYRFDAETDPNFHTDADFYPDPDWYQDNANPADPTPSFTLVGIWDFF